MSTETITGTENVETATETIVEGADTRTIETPTLTTQAQGVEQVRSNVVSDDAFKAMLKGATKRDPSKKTAAKEAVTVTTTSTTKTERLVAPKNDLPIKQSSKGGVIVSLLPAPPAGAVHTSVGCLLPGAPSGEQLLAAAAIVRASRKADPKVSTKRESKTYDVRLTGVTGLGLFDATRKPIEDGVTTFATYTAHYDFMNWVVKQVKERGVKMNGNYTTGLYVGVKDAKVVQIEFQRPVKMQG
jgi:hypothetical protein